MAQESKSIWNFKYTTRDILIIAVLAAIGGIVSAPLGNLWYAMSTALGPVGGAILAGSFMWHYLLAAALVRKPGAALLLGLLSTAVEVVMGNQAGIATFGWGFLQGLAVEAVLAATNYADFSLVTCMLAGAASSQFSKIWTLILYGWDPSIGSAVWTAIPIEMLSGALLSGVLGYYLAELVRKSGLVRSAA